MDAVQVKVEHALQQHIAIEGSVAGPDTEADFKIAAVHHPASSRYATPAGAVARSYAATVLTD